MGGVAGSRRGSRRGLGLPEPQLEGDEHRSFTRIPWRAPRRLAAERDLAEIDEALTRWSSGDYGRCEGCGRSIPMERLRVRPVARRCVPCAERVGG
ncbi:TraR/DksA family transcriptional regulator [Microbacterium sp. P5_E9]